MVGPLCPGGLEELASFVRASRLYVRSFDCPERHRGKASTDYERGLELPGVSVNSLAPGPGNEPLLGTWRPVAFLDPSVLAEANRCYEERLKAERSSKGEGRAMGLQG